MSLQRGVMGDQKLIARVSSDLERLGVEKAGFVFDQFMDIARIEDEGQTLNHSVNVAGYMERIAPYAGMKGDVAYVAGLLHDVGKCDVDQRILWPGIMYGSNEVLEMRKHVSYSYDRLKDDLPVAAVCGLLHHFAQRDNPHPKNKPAFLGKKIMKEVAPYLKCLEVCDFYDASINRISDRRFDSFSDKDKLLKEYHGDLSVLRIFMIN